MLSDLSRRPVLLDMICDTLPSLLKDGARANSAALYEHFTKRWTRRDGWRTSLSEEVRQDFCEALAWLAHLDQLDSIDPELLRDAVRFGFDGAFKTPSELDVFLNDIRTCSFLVRSASESSFRFAHQSFREFFVARRIIRELFGQRCPSRKEVDEFLRKREEAALRDAAKGGSRDKQKEKQTKKNAARQEYSRQGISDLVLGRFDLVRGEHVFPFLSSVDLYDPTMLDVDFDARTSKGLLGSRSIVHNFAHDFRSTGVIISSKDEDLDVAFVQRLEQLFHVEEDAGFIKDLRISPEIANFAVEVLVSSTVNILDFLNGLTEGGERAAFVAILRLAGGAQFAERYSGDLLKAASRRAGSTNHPWWVRVLMPIVIQRGPKLPREHLVATVRNMEGDDLTRILVAMMRSANGGELWQEDLFAGKKLTPLQSVLLSYGEKKLRPEAVAEALALSHLIDLVRLGVARGSV